MSPGALRQARADAKIQAEFTGNLLPLVYGSDTPAFAQAFGDFNAVAEALLEAERTDDKQKTANDDFAAAADRASGEGKE